MTYYSGKDGSMSLVAANGTETLIAKVSSWSLSAQVDVLETTVLNEHDRNFVPGLRTMTGSATIFYYNNPSTGANAPVPLLTHILKTTPVNETDDIFKIELAWANKHVTGNIIITSAELNCAVGEVMQASIQFQFTGAPTALAL
jgi:hypothetical protein